MSKPYVFWDASALVPLCVSQPNTARSLGLLRRFRVVVWWATPIEMTSALTRLLREGGISTGDYAKARLQAERHGSQWRVVAPTAQVAAEARAALERFPLRAADAMQLAAALSWCGGKARGRLFVTFDSKLGQAAELAGFTLA